ncbi:Predicted transcriptional regulators [Paenibacillus uliginis N3/975]|uniref:Predicted transcriptional regulators n=1 Tax=Paenibacillus uliginis N3/975 TaxID=1313296 RepID=A0A1X7GZI7_9BACL|nr:ParB N-terminal domain-containing protein [Paenibacillus uliginis]SMF77025.1 Predicted transcriptional regulators [Paenibacillus uliginis N3/975]
MIDLRTSLKLLPVDNIKMHESFQPTRLEKTMSAILNEKVLINPIVTTRINESDYMIIDGVHRYLSLKELGFKTVACQIVNEVDAKLNMWSHLVKAGKSLKAITDKNLIKVENEINNKRFVFKITDSKQKTLYFYLDNDKNIMNFVDAMHYVVARYDCTCFTRVSQMNKSEIDEEDVLVEFCDFNLKEINSLIFNEVHLPTGVTHFSINNRLLNLKIPLKFMESNISESDWQGFIQSTQEKLRYYPESIYFCE